MRAILLFYKGYGAGYSPLAVQFFLFFPSAEQHGRAFTDNKADFRLRAQD